jgi:hypothetical protein
LGSNSCNASAISGVNPSCGICAAGEQSNDLAINVGKVASGLAATSPASGSSTVQVFSSSTAGLGTLTISVTKAAQAFYQKILLQQWWLRRQERTPK